MRAWTALVLCGTLAAASGASAQVTIRAGAARVDRLGPGDYQVELSHDGRARFYLVHVPPQARAGAPLPVVLNFHGGGGTPKGQVEWTGMNGLADEKGFLAVYPAGTTRPALGRRLLTWNVGFCCGYARDAGVDDVGFVEALLIDLAGRVPVDATRVYATGISNGGMMSYRLAEDLSPRIAAIAPIAGALPDAPRNREPVAVLHFHSVDDPRALYRGGLGPPFPYTNVRVHHTAVEPAVASWAARNGCAAQPRQEAARRGSGRDQGHHAIRLVYPSCTSGYGVEFWKLGGGVGHVWPGGIELKPFVQRHLGPATAVVDANREMWDFLSRYSRPSAPPLWAAAPGPSRAVRLQDVLDDAPLEATFDRSFVSLSATGLASRELDDGMGAYSDRRIGGAAALSLYSHASTRHAQLRVFRLQAHLSARLSTTDLELLGGERRLLRASAGVSAVYVSPALNLFGAFAGVGLSEDTRSLDSPEPRPVAAGLGTWRLGDTFSLLYGAAFAYAFGRPLGLPLLGAAWKPSDRWDASLLLPVVASVGYRPTRELRIAALVVPDGDQVRFTNDGDYGSAAEHLYLRSVALRMGVLATYRLSSDLSAKLDAGVISGGVLSIRDNDTELMSVGMEPGGYATLSFSYGFGSLPY